MMNGWCWNQLAGDEDSHYRLKVNTHTVNRPNLKVGQGSLCSIYSSNEQRTGKSGMGSWNTFSLEYLLLQL